MRTQVLQQQTTGVPWLERYSDEGPAPQQTLLQSFPFSIGRNDSADLTIDSTQVSREHAVVSQHGKKYFIRDLGSGPENPTVVSVGHNNERRLFALGTPSNHIALDIAHHALRRSENSLNLLCILGDIDLFPRHA